MEELGIEGAWLFTPEIHKDDRGNFYEWFRRDLAHKATGIDFETSQVNISESQFGVIRGMHYSIAKQKQAKYVTCIAGRIRDVILDVRVNSKTFGKHIIVELDSLSKRSVLIQPGLAHGFLSLENNSRVCYLQTTKYDPQSEFSIFPLDPSLKINWNFPLDSMIIAERDNSAPVLNSLRDKKMLPDSIVEPVIDSCSNMN
jgi:dTDP-4-dehydrorhamnose 3,5-epimerase